MYPTTIGTMHHRSGGIPAPKFLKFVPNLMGEAGYFRPAKAALLQIFRGTKDDFRR